MLSSISTEALGFFIYKRDYFLDKAFLGAQEMYLHCLVKPEQSRQSSCCSGPYVVADE